MADYGPPGVIDADAARSAAETAVRLLEAMLGALPVGDPALGAALPRATRELEALRAALASG